MKIIKEIANNTIYRNCVIFPGGNLIIQNVTFENCSFRSLLWCYSTTNCVFRGCNFLGVTSLEVVNTSFEGCIMPNPPFLPQIQYITFWSDVSNQFIVSGLWRKTQYEEKKKLVKKWVKWYADQKEKEVVKEKNGRKYTLIPGSVREGLEDFYILITPETYPPSSYHGARLPKLGELQRSLQEFETGDLERQAGIQATKGDTPRAEGADLLFGVKWTLNPEAYISSLGEADFCRLKNYGLPEKYRWVLLE